MGPESILSNRENVFNRYSGHFSSKNQRTFGFSMKIFALTQKCLPLTVVPCRY